MKECARAFTGWTLANGIPGQPYGRYAAKFLYNPDDHEITKKRLSWAAPAISTARTSLI